MARTELSTEELRSETINELERLQQTASTNSTKIKKDFDQKSEQLVEDLEFRIRDIINKPSPDKECFKEAEKLAKQMTEKVVDVEKDAFALLQDNYGHSKNQIKCCYHHACDISETKDKTLRKVYKSSKIFIKSNFKDTLKEIKRTAKGTQLLILKICKDAKKRSEQRAA